MRIIQFSHHAMKSIPKVIPLLVLLLVLSPPIRCAVLDISAKDVDSSPIARMIFQVFLGVPGIDDNVAPIQSKNPRSDRKDNDGDGKIDESDEEFLGFATDIDGRLQLDLKSGLYSIVGFSPDKHLVLVKEVSVPGSVSVSLADAVPVTIRAIDSDGSPIKGAEIFFRPTKRARASVGYTDNNGFLSAYVSEGEYNVVLWSSRGRGPHYLVLPHQRVSPPETKVSFDVRELPTCELHFSLPKSTQIAIFEVMESTYTIEYVPGVEPEIGYDAAYTDFYPLISTIHPYTLSSEMDYNFNMSFALTFGKGSIFAYELRPPIHAIESGVLSLGITETANFKLKVLTDQKDESPVYHPGDKVNLYYYFIDDEGYMLNRILDYTGARLIFPMVTVWDPDGVPIANNFSKGTFISDDFRRFSFDLPLSAKSGEYKADISLDAGIFGQLNGDFRFHVQRAKDTSPPKINTTGLPEEIEFGRELSATAEVEDEDMASTFPKLRISSDAGIKWTEIPMSKVEGNIYQAILTWQGLDLQNVPAELSWQIVAQDTSGNVGQVNGISHIVDTSPPVIGHNLIERTEIGHELVVQAIVTDNMEVREVTLFYTCGRDSSPIMKSLTSSSKDGIYTASIPGSEVTFDGLSYYIRAEDSVGNTSFLPSEGGSPKFAPVSIEDTIAPIISHIPVKFSLPHVPIKITAIITDNSGEVSAKLFYKNSQDQDYRSIEMDKRGETFYGEIPQEENIPGDLRYYILASDAKDPYGKTRSSTHPQVGDHLIVTTPSGGTLARIEISPSADKTAPLRVKAGESVQFSVIGRDEKNNPIPVDVVWIADAGIGHVDQWGLFLSTGRIVGACIGKVSAIALGTSESLLQAETWVQVSPGPPASIMLNPTSVIMMAGNSQNFFVTLTDAYSNPIVAEEVVYKIEGPHEYKIEDTSQSPTIRIDKAGKYKLIAIVGELKAESVLTVLPGQLRRISISAGAELQASISPLQPPPYKLSAGDTLLFSAIGYDAFDNPIPVAPAWSVVGGIGTIGGDGLLRAGTAGVGRVTATVGNVSAEVDVEVAPGPLYSVTVSPYTAYLPVSTKEYNSTQQFVAEGWDIAGNPVPLKSVSFRTDALAGTISPSGLFTAVTDPGVRIGEIVTNGTIYATGTSDSGKQVTGNAYVVIQKSPASRIAEISVLAQGTSASMSGISLAVGESVRFEAVGIDPKGQKVSVIPTWKVFGGIGNIDINGVFVAGKPGRGEVIASAGGFTGRIEVEVKIGSLKTLIIKPNLQFLNPGAQVTLTAIGYDAGENIVPLDNVRWSIKGDSAIIKPSGASCLVIAYNKGELRHKLSLGTMVFANVGDIVGTANVFVRFSDLSFEGRSTDEISALPYYLEIDPQAVNVPAGSQQQFTVRTFDILGNERENSKLSWFVSGNIGEVSQDGRFSAFSVEGETGYVIVTDGRVSARALISVSLYTSGMGEPFIFPYSLSLPAGTRQKFFVFVKSSGKISLPNAPTWKVEGNIGTISADGIFLAGTPGKGVVSVRVGTLYAKCDVTVLPGNPAFIEIQPSSLSIRSGDHVRFKVTCRDKNGIISEGISSDYVFEVTGEIGKMEDSLFTAQMAGAGNVTVRVQGTAVFSKVDVEVLPGELSEIEVIPGYQEVRAGNSVRFSAIGRDRNGNFLSVDPLWETLSSADIGTVSSNGLFIADKTGTGNIKARVGMVEGSANLRVTSAYPAFIMIEPAIIFISSQTANNWQFKAEFFDLRGNTVIGLEQRAELSWEVTENVGSIDPKTGLFVNKANLKEVRTGYVTAKAIFNAGTPIARTIRGKATVILLLADKPLATITVTPDPALVIKGDSQKFTVIGKDIDGIEVEVHPTWRVFSNDGKTEIKNAISAEGIFKATSEMEVGSSFLILASAKNSEGKTIQGTAKLELIAGPLQSIEVVAVGGVSLSSVESGKLIEFEAIGYDLFHNAVTVSPKWKVTNQIGDISPLTTNRAAMVAGLAGSGEVIASTEGKEGKIHVTVVPGPLVGISIVTANAEKDEGLGASIENPLIVKAGSEVYFSAVGRDSDVDMIGRKKPVNIIDISPIWSLTPLGEAIGFISPDGKFAGRSVGTGYISASVGSVTGRFFLKVIPGELSSIRVTPSFVSIVSGKDPAQRFSAEGYDSWGNKVEGFRPVWRVVGNIGNIDENGLFAPVSLPHGGSAISGSVVADYNGIQGSASVTVLAEVGELSAIFITIEPPTVQAGGKAECFVRGIDNMGNPISLPSGLKLSLSAELGTIGQTEEPDVWQFHAIKLLPNDPQERHGLVVADVEVNGNLLSASASFELVPAQLYRIIIEPASGIISAGEEWHFKAYGFDAFGNQRELPDLKWTVLGNIGKVSPSADGISSAIFSATLSGKGQLIASSSGCEGRADILVQPGQLSVLTIEPRSATITAGSSQRFTGKAWDAYGNLISAPELRYKLLSVLPIGSIAEDGLFLATKVGDGKLKVEHERADGVLISDSADITVIPGVIASASIAIHYEGKTLEPPLKLLSGARYELLFQGTDLFGNQVTDIKGVTWKVAEDIGSIVGTPSGSASIVLETLFPGYGEIFAGVGKIQVHIEVEIVPHSQDISSREGGVLRGPFGSFIAIPPGALRKDERISIALSPSPKTAESVQRVGYVYSGKPSGYVFMRPVEISIPIPSSETNYEKLSLYSWDNFGRDWIRLGGKVDPERKSIIANVNFLSLFTIMKEDLPEEHPAQDRLSLDIRLSPNAYFAPEINRFTIHYNIGCVSGKPVDITMEIYDMEGRLVRKLLNRSPKYPGWNTDQWDGTDGSGRVVKNGRYLLLVLAETDKDKVSKIKHIAVFR